MFLGLKLIYNEHDELTFYLVDEVSLPMSLKKLRVKEAGTTLFADKSYTKARL